MKKMILETNTVSKSGNIALYPSLAISNTGHLAIAWYEYGSPYETDRSDIWLSLQDRDGNWTAPVNISGNISYNNGPSLSWVNKRDNWCCAWHSWRPPGKEPFIANGDITNIWFSNVSIDGVVQQPNQAITDFFNTEYASLAETPDGQMQLLYFDRTSQLQHFAKSDIAPPFLAGTVLPENIGEGQHGDLAFDADGTAWVAYVGADGGIYLTSKIRDGDWSSSQRIDESNNIVFTRPKISLDSEGTVWVSCHSNTWGSRTSSYRIKVTDAQLSVRFESDGSPGNHCWTCNTVSLESNNYKQIFSFGPDVFKSSKGITAITEENSQYKKDRGYGFDNKPRSQLRKLGDDLTRGLFYDSTLGVFRINIPNGIYDVEVVHSSWVAPRSGTKVFFENEIMDSELPPQENDAVYIFKVKADKDIQNMMVSNGGNYDENRPSKIIHDLQTGRKHLAWTSYGPDSVSIVHASFAFS